MRDGKQGLPAKSSSTTVCLGRKEELAVMSNTDLDKAEDAITAIWAVVVLIPATPFLIGYFLALAVVQGLIKLGRFVTTGHFHPRRWQPIPRRDTEASPRYYAHGPDGRIIGEYGTVEECEITGLLACGVKPVDLPLVLHERRRLGTYGGLYEGNNE
jgi:hypothetical protein